MSANCWCRVAAVCVGLAGWFATGTAGAVVVAPDDRIPNPAGPYVIEDHPIVFGMRILDGKVSVLDGEGLHSPMMVPGSGTLAVDSFFDIFFDITTEDLTTGGMQHHTGMGTGHVNGEGVGQPPAPILQLDTEFLALNLNLGPLMIRESPTLPSRGMTDIANLGDGGFRIDSFFDIFTELSIDGGQTWLPAEVPLHFDQQAPEPATLLLAGLAALPLIVRRRR